MAPMRTCSASEEAISPTIGMISSKNESESIKTVKSSISSENIEESTAH